MKNIVNDHIPFMRYLDKMNHYDVSDNIKEWFHNTFISKDTLKYDYYIFKLIKDIELTYIQIVDKKQTMMVYMLLQEDGTLPCIEEKPIPAILIYTKDSMYSEIFLSSKNDTNGLVKNFYIQSKQSYMYISVLKGDIKHIIFDPDKFYTSLKFDKSIINPNPFNNEIYSLDYYNRIITFITDNKKHDMDFDNFDFESLDENYNIINNSYKMYFIMKNLYNS